MGIKAPSIHHHFATKADLGAAVARRYWEDTVRQLAAISDETPDPLEALRRYPEIFRKSLSNDNRICLSSFMAAEYDDLPDAVRTEVRGFADVNVAWLSKLLADANLIEQGESETRAQAIYAAVAGAQLFARGRSDIALFDTMIDSYRAAGSCRLSCPAVAGVSYPSRPLFAFHGANSTFHSRQISANES